MNTKDDAPEAGMGVPVRADLAALTVAGEHWARIHPDRLGDGTTQPGELAAKYHSLDLLLIEAATLCHLRGELLHGSSRLLETALEGRRNA
jgi:hypothetical protein